MPAKNFTMPAALAQLWVSIDEAKQLLGVSHTTVYQLARTGEIKHAKYQGRAIFGRRSIDRYLATWTREEKRLMKVGQ
jgi:excisionase family DNA binding protein